MNENYTHFLLSAFIENLRKEKRITIKEFCSEAHISTKTYSRIKKGMM